MTSNPSAPTRLPVLVNLNTGERYTIDGPSVMIGRAPDNNILLTDEFVSAVHARVYWAQGWWIEDLKSSNGTSVNDQLITEPVQLRPGFVIKVGHTLFRIE